MKKYIFVFLLLIISSSSLYARSYLLYTELQGIYGYSSLDNKGILHSAMKHDIMQKNSVGFDLLQQINPLSFSLQFRLAYDDSKENLQPQFYNAYIKIQTTAGRFWLGHNRTALGLNSYWDLHADLVGALAMQGVWQENDWGAGYERDTDWGDIKFTASLGSGAGICYYDNYVVSGRISYGVLNRDNWTTGLSFLAGKPLDVMGYDVMDENPDNTYIVAVDGAYNYLNTEQKCEIDYGKLYGENLLSAVYRFSFWLDEEQRFQPSFQECFIKKENQKQFETFVQLSYLITEIVTVRAAYQYNSYSYDNRVLGQVYIYFSL